MYTEEGSNRYTLLSTLSDSKVTVRSKILSSPNISSSHANNLHLQLQAPLLTNNLVKRSLKGIPPTHTPVQKRILLPSPTNWLTLPWNHSSERKAEMSLHQIETSRPPSFTRPSTTPYLADSTLYHKFFNIWKKNRF